jgi:hypothetical protein
MRKLVVAGAAVGLLSVAFTFSLRSEPPDRVNAVSAFMKLKLDHSERVLEGLALEDYERIAKHAGAMALLSQESSWQVLQTEEYLQQSMEFRRTAHALREAAREKNIDGATLAYMELTMKCVSCHKYVRQVRTAGRQP